MRKNNPTIFASYSWHDKKLVDTIDRDLGSIGITVVRDIRDAKKYKSIKKFMNRIRKEDFVLIIISEFFLKSSNCLYEILELIKDDTYKNRIIPIVLRSRFKDLFSVEAMIEYKDYWINKFNDLENKCQNFGPDDMESIANVFKHIRNIRIHIGEFLEVIRDIKSVPIEELQRTHYKSVIERIGFDQSKLLVELIRTLHITDDEEQDIAVSDFIKMNPSYYMGYYHWGNIEFDRNNYKKSLRNYNEAIKLNAEDPNLFNDRGTTYYKLREYESSIEDYNNAIKIDPDNPKYYYSRGTTYDEIESYEEAIVDYTKAIELHPEDDSFYNNRGSTFFKMNRFKEALRDYNKALELNPDNAMASINKAMVYKVKKSEGAVKSKPEDALIYYNQANEYADLKKYNDAILNYSMAIKIYPSFYEAWFNRGITSAELGKYEEALKDYSIAITIDSNDAEIYYAQGNSYKKIKKYNEAIDSYSEALKLKDEYLSALKNRGNTYAELGDYKRALKNYEKIQKIAPNPRTLLMIDALKDKDNHANTADAKSRAAD